MKLSRIIVISLMAIALVSLAGCGKSTSPTQVVTSLDTTPPPVPENVSVNETNAASSLSWDASGAADVAKYQVYQYQPDPARDNAYVLIGETSGTSFSLPVVTTATDGYFRIKAVDNAGNGSAYSTMVQAALTLSPSNGGNGTPPNVKRTTVE